MHVLFTLVLFALATAYRRLTEQTAVGSEPVGWQRWRRQLFQQNRDKVIVFAGGSYGSFHGADYSLLVGITLNDVPPGIRISVRPGEQVWKGGKQHNQLGRGHRFGPPSVY